MFRFFEGCKNLPSRIYDATPTPIKYVVTGAAANISWTTASAILLGAFKGDPFRNFKDTTSTLLITTLPLGSGAIFGYGAYWVNYKFLARTDQEAKDAGVPQFQNAEDCAKRLFNYRLGGALGSVAIFFPVFLFGQPQFDAATNFLATVGMFAPFGAIFTGPMLYNLKAKWETEAFCKQTDKALLPAATVVVVTSANEASNTETEDFPLPTVVKITRNSQEKQLKTPLLANTTFAVYGKSESDSASGIEVQELQVISKPG